MYQSPTNFQSDNITSNLKWPYRLQAHPTDPNKLSSQQILGHAMAADAPYRRIGFGGPKGGGKSYGARAVAFTLTYHLAITVIIVRSRLITLKRNHIIPAKNELRDFIDREIIRYSENDKTFYMPSGGLVSFMYCASDQDVEQFDGVAGDVYILEEAGHFNEHQIQGMIKNNRSSDIAINRNVHYNPRVLFTFNWGGPGHEYLRRRFWDQIYTEKERAEDYLFIFAPLDQNLKLIQSDPNYKQTLMELPPQLREAYLTGDPDAFVGTMFTVIREFHEVDPIEILAPYNEGVDEENYLIPDHWRLFGSIDPGIGAHCSFALYAITPEGQRYKFNQYYVKDPSLKAPGHVNNIMDKIRACRWTGGSLPEFIVADTFAFQKHNPMGLEAGDITWEDLFAAEGIPLYQAKYNQLTAIMAVHTGLYFELSEDNTELEVEPKLQFFQGECEATINELQAAKHSETNPELLDATCLDHAIDETKNLILVAQAPPDFVPVKKLPKVDPKADYGSGIDKMARFLFGDRARSGWRNKM